ncbi:MAG: hypothetical protein ACREQJ_18050 [Candidatus Binatia bacterium]
MRSLAIVVLAATITNAGASFYDSGAGKIVVDEGATAEELALAVVHAAHHARSDKDGSRAKVERETRARYVEKMLAEEAAAVAAAIETKRDLQANGKTVLFRNPLEREYDEAYRRAVARLRQSTASPGVGDLEAAAKAAARAAVHRGFVTGKVVSATTARTVPDYYARTWARSHPSQQRGGVQP